jgi:protease I
MSAEALKVLLVVASSNFNWIEFSDTKKALESKNIVVVVGSDKLGNAQSTDKKSVAVDIDVSHVDTLFYDGVFIIGGSGAHELLDCPSVYKLIHDCDANNKIFGAICYSPRILAKAGVLRGKKATGWNGDNLLGDVFKKYEATYDPQAVVVDGFAITADGPSSAYAFGLAIAQSLRK